MQVSKTINLDLFKAFVINYSKAHCELTQEINPKLLDSEEVLPLTSGWLWTEKHLNCCWSIVTSNHQHRAIQQPISPDCHTKPWNVILKSYTMDWNSLWNTYSWNKTIQLVTCPEPKMKCIFLTILICPSWLQIRSFDQFRIEGFQIHSGLLAIEQSMCSHLKQS